MWLEHCSKEDVCVHMWLEHCSKEDVCVHMCIYVCRFVAGACHLSVVKQTVGQGSRALTFVMLAMKTSFLSSPVGSITSKVSPKSQNALPNTPYTSELINWKHMIIRMVKKSQKTTKLKDNELTCTPSLKLWKDSNKTAKHSVHITADKLKYIPLPKCLKYHRTHHQPLCTVHTSELTKWKTHQQNHPIYYRTHWHTLCTYQSWCFEHITSQLMPRTYNIITADALNTKHHHSWCTEHITSSELMHWTHNIIRADAHNIIRADTLNT